MRILSNDYTSSLPNSNFNVKGGPPRFSIDFSAYTLAHGHEWVGLLHDIKLKSLYESLGRSGGKTFFSAQAPTATHEALRELHENVQPDVFFANEIAVLESVLRIVSPDIVFINGFSAFAWILSASARRLSLPVVIQHAGIWHKEIDLYADLFPLQARTMSYLMEREAAEHVTANIFLNTFSQKAFELIVGTKKVANASIIPLPHPGWSFTDSFHPKTGPDRILGVVARWDRIKNHEAILALAEAIKSQGLPWRIRSVTSIPDTPTKAEFKSRYRELIEVVAPMDRKLLSEFFRASDALILPSHFDVSPTVVMEAVTHGIPTLISPNVGWVSEYQECDMENWIGDFDDPGAIISQLRDNFALPDWPEVSQFANYVKKCHNPDIVYSSYLRLFTTLSADR